ncbi:MAG: 30S ribosomal protein S8 [Chlorobi bacterium]|nr:30S ribosomal protein S8 [Chlorobiota bacterium]
MPVTDSVSDFLTRIRNAGQAGHKSLEMPASKMKASIASILADQGFIKSYEKTDDGIQGTIKIALRYFKGKSVILKMTRISKPGRRVYASVEELPRVQNGLGIAIISTSKGVMTDKLARKEKVGGEVLCTIW